MAAWHPRTMSVAGIPWAAASASSVRIRPVQSWTQPGSGGPLLTSRRTTAPDFRLSRSESQRAAISRIPGVTFLPFSATQASAVYVLLLRNMLVSTSFALSPQDITRTGNPAAAAAAVGPYYPCAAVCPLASLTVNGPQACQR
jgi:hypothetical protein